jgi:hypothetical protein
VKFVALTAPNGEPVYIAPGFIIRKVFSNESYGAAKTRISVGAIVEFVTEDVEHVLVELEKI